MHTIEPEFSIIRKLLRYRWFVIFIIIGLFGHTMETEIEIKFLFNSKFEQELINKIEIQRCISTKKQLLHNVYFDTADRLLRKMDMGLRVRSCDNRSVQTIKTAGRVIGGLHQRPEYNESIEGLRPELARFQDKIWPGHCDVKALEEDLIPIFSTDFERRTWLVEMADDTLIEVAYDRGFIETNQDNMDLCEVELELVKGDETQLFLLADEIALLPEVRLGNVSKAQRGYMLIDKASFQVKTLVSSPLHSSQSIQQALLVNLQHGFKHLQYHENCYIESGQQEALNELLTGVKFLHQNLALFKSSDYTILNADWVDDLHWLARSFSWLDESFTYSRLLENKGHYLRKLPKFKGLIKKIEKQSDELPAPQESIKLLTSTRYCQFILKFTRWLIQFEKSSFTCEKTDSITEFSAELLKQNWGELSASLSSEKDLLLKKLLSYQGLLERNLLTDISFGALFLKDVNKEFHSPWIDIQQGLKKLEMVNIIADFSEFESDKKSQEEMFKWIKRKQDSLLHALLQSKEQALLEEVYWD